MNKQELEAKKLEDFITRLKGFLANDPYWVYVLAMEGGRTKRRQVGDRIKKLVTTIPRIGEHETNDGSADVLVLNRATRRGIRASQRRAR